MDVTWLCEATKKLQEFDGHLIPKVIEECVQSSITRHGMDEAKSFFSKDTFVFLNDVLGRDAWNTISAKLN